MSAGYLKLLRDLHPRRRVILWEVGYRLDWANYIERLADDGYATQAGDSVEYPFRGIVLTSTSGSSSIFEGGIYGGLAVPDVFKLEWQNKPKSDGTYYDHWRTDVSVDNQPIRALMVGETGDGTVVGYDEAAAQPFFSGVGIGRPEVFPHKVAVQVRAMGGLERQMATRRFSPPCLRFPGTSAGYVDFGDVLDRTGSFTWEGGWIKTDDPSLSGQTIVEKDTGAAGWRLELGTAGSGALRFIVREQSPTTSDTATGLIRIGRWHHVAIAADTAAGKRYVFVDGTLVLTTSGVTGSPAGNSATLKVGKGFKGCISWGRAWSTVRTAADIRTDLFLPVASTATGLDDLLLLAEGTGSTTAGTKAGSTVSGTLGTGVRWAQSGWCGSSLAGKYWPVVIGKKLDLKLTPNDPAGNRFGVCWPCLKVEAVRSNHLALTPTAQYTVDTSRGPGIATLTAAAGGVLSADVVGETTFNGALNWDGTGAAAGSATCPPGSMSLGVLMRSSVTEDSLRIAAGWRSGGGAGLRNLGFVSGANNRLRWAVINDAGTLFTAAHDGTPQDRWIYALGVLDTTASQIRLYVDGELKASTTVSGTFNTVSSSFAIAKVADTSAGFFKGDLDEVSLWNTPLGESDAERLTVLPSVGNESGLVQLWACDAGSGSTLSNSVSGGASLALSGGYAWTYSRIAPCDNFTTALLRYASYSSASLDVASLAAWIQQTAADSGWSVEDDQSVRHFLHTVLRGSGSYARQAIETGLLQAGQVEIPSGTPDENNTFPKRDVYFNDIAPASDTLGSAYYGVVVHYGHNGNAMTADQLAGIVSSDPERYQFAQAEWREAEYAEPDILNQFPTAKLLRVDSTLIREADALAEAERIFPLYLPTCPPIDIPLRTSANQVQVGGEIQVTYETADGTARLGMGSPGACFRVVAVRRSRNGRRVTASCVGVS